MEKQLLKFDRQEYRQSAKKIVAARKVAEEVADKISKKKFKNIFFVAVGGSLAPMMVVSEFAKELTTIPVFVEQAAELMVTEHKHLSKDSIVITLSKSGDTKETVEIAKKCKEKGITVISCTANPKSPLGLSSTYIIPMEHKNGVEYEYMLLYWLFFRIIHNNGEFEDYQTFAQGLTKLPDDLEKIKEVFDAKAKEIAKKHHDDDIQYWIGSKEMWGEVYLFSMCILEEMQWIKTKSVTSSEFFHGTLELIDKNVNVFLVKGEGNNRILDERCQKFLEKYTDRLVVIDTQEFALEYFPDKYRRYVSPLICSTCLVDRLSKHFESYTKHNLDYRRYYRQFEY